MKKHALWGLSALVLAVSALSAGAAPRHASRTLGQCTSTPAPGNTRLVIGSQETFCVLPSPRGSPNICFRDDLAGEITSHWRIADWDSPGNCKNNVDNITFNGGAMQLELNDTPAGGFDYSCAEYETTAEYGYGTYSARIKASSRHTGVVTGFFVYHGPPDTPDHDEIDFEFLAKQPRKVQLNYFVGGVGGHEQTIDLGFNASQDYHTYTFSWMNSAIVWSVDGNPVRTATVLPLPTIPGKIKVNLWNPYDIAWAGEFIYDPPGTPINSLVDYISFVPVPP